jgi:hypothetical protein
MRRTIMLLAVLASPVMAQSDHVVAMGDRVRIVAPETGYQKLVGRVVSTTPDALALKVDGAAGEFEVQRRDIVSIAQSTGRRRHVAKGLRIGVPAGFFSFIFFGPKKKMVDGRVDPDEGSPIFKNMLIGATAGAAVGGAIGWLVRTDDWTPILARPKAAGLSVGLSVRY